MEKTPVWRENGEERAIFVDEKEEYEFSVLKQCWKSNIFLNQNNLNNLRMDGIPGLSRREQSKLERLIKND